jgi:anti-sigma28 factor (negative regulator of flagellin synthesis)
MRVDERTLSEQTASTASRANESQRIQVDTSASSGASRTASGDRVDLSSLTGRISQAMDALSAQTTQRVSQLQKDVRAGRYQPGADQISHAMVAGGAIRP